MPTYEYKCLKCSNLFEYFQPITSEPLEKCPECGGKVKRLIGAGLSPIFKGSGFYQTDYKSNSGNSGGNGKTASTSVTKNKDTKITGAKKPAARADKK